MNKLKMDLKSREGITLISLVVTIIILIILASISISMILGNNGLLNKAQTASDETKKSQSTETMNLKITNIQISSYAETQELPNLQYLADKLCEDNDIEYVLTASKEHASLDKIDVTNISSIFTKLKEYPYEFEINSSLQLASIDGVKVADNDKPNTDNWSSKNTWEKLFDIGFTVDEIINNEVIFEKVLNKDVDIDYMMNTNDIMNAIANSQNAMTTLGKNTLVSFKLISTSSLYNVITSSPYSSCFDSGVTSVPAMTSNTTPFGIVSSSQIYSTGYEAWRAFDKKNGEGYKWASKGNIYDTARYIQYEFQNPNYIYKISLTNHTYSTNECPTAFELWASNDGINWFTIVNKTAITNISLGAINDYLVPYTGQAYKYYRICGLSCTSGNTCIGELQLYCVVNE